jgi:hypothetical protein
MHSIVHKYGPPILFNLWTNNIEQNPNVGLRNAHDLYIPTSSSEQVNKLPLIVFAKMWNTLHDNKLHANPVLFRSLLKEHIWSTLNNQ